MNKFLVSVLVVLVLAVGGLSLRKPTVTVNVPAPVSNSTPSDALVGAAASPFHYTPEAFVRLGYIGALSTSSSSPAAYGSSASFQMVVPAATTVGTASTVAVTSLSNRVSITQSRSTGIAGTTCNTTTIATGTATTLFASSTNMSLNGIIVTVPSAPVTNPYCYDVTVFAP